MHPRAAELLLVEDAPRRLIQYVGPRIGIEGAAANALPVQPVVFDEAQDGSLICDAVVYVVAPGKRGDHQQRQAGTIAATALGMGDGRSRKRSCSVAALAGGSQAVGAAGRLVCDGTHLVVVPAIGI